MMKPVIDALGFIIKFSVKFTPIFFSVSKSLNMVAFSLCSGQVGYPGAGRIPSLSPFGAYPQ